MEISMLKIANQKQNQDLYYVSAPPASPSPPHIALPSALAPRPDSVSSTAWVQMTCPQFYRTSFILLYLLFVIIFDLALIYVMESKMEIGCKSEWQVFDGL